MPAKVCTNIDACRLGLLRATDRSKAHSSEELRGELLVQAFQAPYCKDQVEISYTLSPAFALYYCLEPAEEPIDAVKRMSNGSIGK